MAKEGINDISDFILIFFLTKYAPRATNKYKEFCRPPALRTAYNVRFPGSYIPSGRVLRIMGRNHLVSARSMIAVINNLERAWTSVPQDDKGRSKVVGLAYMQW